MHVVACASDKLGMLLNTVAVVVNANALATLVATGNEMLAMFHVGHGAV